MTSEQSPWSFFQLPPFFTMQPAPISLMRQVNLWGNLIMDHAAYHATKTRPGACSFLRLYKSTSDVFYNPSLNRRLPPDAARRVLEALTTQQPNHCAAIVSENAEDKDFAVLIACNTGGLKEIEQSLLSWILERGAGTTVAHIAQKGVVMTFDELVENKCLTYRREKEPIMARISEDSVPIADVATLSEEQSIRILLQALKNRPVSILRPFSITLFNLDGSERQPYQGVKFGGVAV